MKRSGALKESGATLAICCVATADWLPFARVAIESCQACGLDGQAFVMTDDLNAIQPSDARGLIDRGIRVIESTWAVSINNRVSYRPTLAFSVFEIPERMLDLGYSHSLVIDADVFLVREFDWRKLVLETISFSGACPNKLIENFTGLETDWQSEDYDLRNPNTGFLLINNNWAKEVSLLSKADLEANQAPSLPAGDQSLLAWLIWKHKWGWRLLPDSLNFRLGNLGDLASAAERLRNAHVLHFTGRHKPWKRLSWAWFLLPARYVRFLATRKWRRFFRNSQNREQRIPRRAA